MKKFGLLGTSALGSFAAIALSMAAASPAFAQQQESTDESDPPETLQGEIEEESGQDAQENDTPGSPIVVTGSRIRRPNLESPVPVTSIGGEEFAETGQVSVGDVLNELPSLRSTFSQANSSRFLGTGGLNLLDLRGLGTQRTLVLVNGRRHVGADILNNAVSPDVNTFPTDLIERVDIVTGGSSAIYGSDAIAGVVNFILRRNFDGFQLRAQGGVSQYGDGGSYFVSGVAGTNFADNRGNIAINLEYARQQPIYGAGRPNLRTNDGFVVVDTDPAGSPNGSDGLPDRVFIRDIRSASLSNAGTIRFGGNNNLNCGRDAANNPFTCNFVFDQQGNLAPQTGTRVGLGPFGSFAGGNGSSFRTGREFGVFPELDRYIANVIGHFTVSEAFEPFIELKYARVEAAGLINAGPAFITGFTLGDIREQPRFDNPFFTEQARTVIRQQRAAAGLGTGNATRIGVRRNLTDLGVREEQGTRETWRGVVGVRGEIMENWNYEVSANYGRFTEDTFVGGNLDIQRFLLAADAVRDPATGNIVCRSKIDPNARLIYPFVSNEAFAQARLAADVAACVPINLVGGERSITEAARNYVLTDSTSNGRITQFVANAFVAGDTANWFELPGGPIGIALGLEYRRDDAFSTQDEQVAAGLTFYNALGTFDPSAVEVREAFGEIRLPLLDDLPFIEELTVSAAARVSDYSQGPAGTVVAWNAGVEWTPIRDLRLRGNFSRAVRAPNLADLFTEQFQNFAFVNDPCSARNLGTGSTTRPANCAAAGRPADYDFVPSQTLEILSGGNPNLQEEKSDSYTIGGVFTPRWFPGFSFTADYYDITVNNVISAPSAQNIVNACYDAASIQNNPFCALFQRAGPGGGPRGEIPFQILEGSLMQTLLNFAALTARGIDVEAAYRRRLEGFGTLNTRFTYTHGLERSNFLNPIEPERANRILGELGDPIDAFNWNISLENGGVTVGYQMRYIGRQVLNAYEDFFSVQGRPPENEDYADRRFYPSVLYHDARLAFDASRDFNFYIGIDNFTNRQPPLGLTGVGGGSGIYDARGRFFYAGARARF